MSDRWDVLIPSSIHPAGKDRLEEFADVVEFEETEGFESAWDRLGDVEAIIVRVAEVDEPVLDRASSLRVISKHGIGLDNVAVDVAAQRGVVVCNLPALESSRQSVAEHVLSTFLALRKGLVRADRETKAGGWHRNRYAAPLADGDVLGLYGVGNIGARTAKLAGGFGMETIGFDPYVAAAEFPEGVEKVDSKTALFDRSDVVSVHAPLTEETREAISTAELDRLEDGILINAARGPIVDEDALVAALESGHLAGAGIDTFETEPPSADNPLFEYDSVIATPHCAGASEESLRDLSVGAAENIRAVHDGNLPESTVNETDLGTDE